MMDDWTRRDNRATWLDVVKQRRCLLGMLIVAFSVDWCWRAQPDELLANEYRILMPGTCRCSIGKIGKDTIATEGRQSEMEEGE